MTDELPSIITVDENRMTTTSDIYSALDEHYIKDLPR